MSATTIPATRTHLDINDGSQRAAFAQQLGITEERLGKGVRMVGSRLTTLRDHFQQ